VNHATTLARCYWKVGEAAKAAKEFEALVRETQSPQVKRYFKLCLNAAEIQARERSAEPADLNPSLSRGEANAK